MRRGAVGLGDEARRRPQKVDLEAGDSGVDSRPREAGPDDECEEPLLQLAAGDVGVGECEALQGLAEAPRAAARKVSQQAFDRGGVKLTYELGAVAGALELMGSQDVGEIDQCASDGRDRQAVGLAYDVIEGVECAASMHP